jgi:hypothetical protein
MYLLQVFSRTVFVKRFLVFGFVSQTLDRSWIEVQTSIFTFPAPIMEMFIGLAFIPFNKLLTNNTSNSKHLLVINTELILKASKVWFLSVKVVFCCHIGRKFCLLLSTFFFHLRIQLLLRTGRSGGISV